jgi:endonuclease/exonuclease/phosphatase family protein
MPLTLMSYNIENMRHLFDENGVAMHSGRRVSAITKTILAESPHILGIVEASDSLKDHETLTKTSDLASLNFQIAKSSYKRDRQDMVVYYRDPFELVSIDENISFYKSWSEDIDEDSIVELLRFERKPLEVVLKNRKNGHELLIILVSFKSKAVFSVSDIHRYEHLALANRKKLYAQSKKVRERLNKLFDENPDRAVVVMGDLNDEIGLDHFQKQIGTSAVETITGNIHEPSKILHNTMWHLTRRQKSAQDLWTHEYEDPIVANFKKHKAWLDYIFVSPGMLKGDAPCRYILESGCVVEKTDAAKLASDHFPVRCEMEVP